MWNKIPDTVRRDVLSMALDIPELSPRELAVRFTDTKGYFVSESSVYRLLKAHDLISSPAFIVMKAASEFKDKTTAINQMWQTDFTYFKIIGWGWMYLSTVLDDFSRYIISWKLCTTMKTSDVTDTLNMALVASGCDQANVVHKPRLLSDNGSSYPMSDHRMIYRRFGLEHLISIDGEEHVVERQRFNKPTDKTKCLHLRSDKLIENFDVILKNNEVPDSATRVVWMDFTEPNKLLDQLSQFEQLLETLGEGDIVRITLNANESSLKMAKPDGSKPKPIEVAVMDRGEQREARFRRLQNDLGSYLPSSTTQDDLSNDMLPILLGKLLERAAGSAFPSGSSQHAFFPLSSLVYRDGQQMITVTGAIIDRHHFDQVEVIMALENWPFSVNKISDFKRLSVSTLTLKERLLMERLVLADEEIDIVERLGFSKFGSTDAKVYFEDFKAFSRFYPNHAVVEY